MKVDTMRASMFPCIRYEDEGAALDWLEKAFGFERHSVHEAPDGSIAHAELRFGGGMLMLGAGPDTKERHSVYVHVPDIDAHYERATAAGAEIVRPLQDTDYGSREYGARDPDGHVWYFGTYHPQDAD